MSLPFKMAPKTVCVYLHQTAPIKVLKWKVKVGHSVSIGRALLLYELVSTESTVRHRLKAKTAGIVKKIVASEGAIVSPGELLCEMKECTHPTIVHDMCADCGSDLREEESTATASVPMVHAIPELKVSEELAQKIGTADNERLIKDRKLVLLVDLDQTLIHTTNDNIPANIKDVHHFQLYGPHSPWYHTRLRPGTHEFLENMAPLFEMHICTFGARNYAHTIARLLDPDQKYFSNRILSRDECFDPTSKKANLKALFPCGDNMVCIIDDREDVWSHASNLIHVKPYHFFQHTGDINAPPGLDKHEQDDDEQLSILDLPTIDAKVIPNDVSQCDKKVGEHVNVEPSNDVGDSGIKEHQDQSKANKLDTEENSRPNGASKLTEIDDPDDYLLHLEDILKRIHEAFYRELDSDDSDGSSTDLKCVIPNVRSEVLRGCTLVFSGLVPTHMEVKESRAYQIALALGAEVKVDLDEECTHLVAVRAGTVKVNSARKGIQSANDIKIVTADWLWSCAERWEHVDEKLFPLTNNSASKNRHPPAHCSSPEHNQNNITDGSPAIIRKRTLSGRFMDTINPLMSLSTADLADMDKEVEDILDEGDSNSSSSSEDNTYYCEDDENNTCHNDGNQEHRINKKNNFTKHKRRRKAHKKINHDNLQFDEENSMNRCESSRLDENEDESDIPDRGDESNDGDVSNMGDDGEEWSMMGAALEREFLSSS